MSKAGESAFSARRERARLLPFRRGLPHSAGLYPQRAQIRFVLGRDAVAFDRFLNRFIVYPRGEAAFFDEWDRAFALLCDRRGEKPSDRRVYVRLHRCGERKILGAESAVEEVGHQQDKSEADGVDMIGCDPFAYFRVKLTVVSGESLRPHEIAGRPIIYVGKKSVEQPDGLGKILFFAEEHRVEIVFLIEEVGKGCEKLIRFVCL